MEWGAERDVDKGVGGVEGSIMEWGEKGLIMEWGGEKLITKEKSIME